MIYFFVLPFLPPSLSDAAPQRTLVGPEVDPDVGGPAAPAGRCPAARGGWPGVWGGRHGAQHAAAETQEQHLVGVFRSESPCGRRVTMATPPTRHSSCRSRKRLKEADVCSSVPQEECPDQSGPDSGKILV